MDSKNRLYNKKVLITCGPTWIPIDDMRIISNKSTGTLGQLMADDFANAGAKVTLLEGPVTKALDSYIIRVVKFYFYDEFLKLMKKELKKKYDVVIHAAAVSDYKLSKPYRAKLTSKLTRLSLDLVPTQKIIHLIKDWNPKAFLVGFKLESKMNRRTAFELTRDLFEQAKCDLVVANTTTDTKYTAYILNKKEEILAQEKTRLKISKMLLKVIKENL